jgi:hypothetical protein
MASKNYSMAANSRSEQMKRELIGLVIGTSLLMAGMAFLFSQTLVADDPVSVATADTTSKTESVVQEQPLPAAPPPVAAVTAPASPTTTPALATRDVATADTAVVLANAAETAATPRPVAATPAEPPVSSTPPAQDKAAAAVTATEASTAAAPPEDAAAEEKPGKTGWLYAGQFANGKWTEQGLKVGGELPASGGRYSLTWGATVRDNPPGKRGSANGKLGKTIANLAPGREVEIVQVKKSGKQGHVWVEVKL